MPRIRTAMPHHLGHLPLPSKYQPNTNQQAMLDNGPGESTGSCCRSTTSYAGINRWPSKAPTTTIPCPENRMAIVLSLNRSLYFAQSRAQMLTTAYTSTCIRIVWRLAAFVVCHLSII